MKRDDMCEGFLMATFSISAGEESGITLKRGAGPSTFANGELQAPDAVLIKEFKAASWDEACQIENDHYEWGHHMPNDDWEEIGPDEE